MAFTNNFSTSFRWWDRVLGTDDKYLAYRKRVDAAKAAMKNASKEDKEKMEQAMMKEIEAEGKIAEAEAEKGNTSKIERPKVKVQ